MHFQEMIFQAQNQVQLMFLKVFTLILKNLKKKIQRNRIININSRK